MTNIYRLLGAKPRALLERAECPCVYNDGSTDEATKAWAIAKLGFNDPRITYHSWCELHPSKSSVVPSRVEIEGVMCHLSPLSKPGMFDLEWARVYGQSRCILDLTPDELYEAVLKAQARASNLINEFDSMATLVRTNNSHYDSRFECKDGKLFKDGYTRWFCDGREVKHVPFSVCIPFNDHYYRFV